MQKIKVKEIKDTGRKFQDKPVWDVWAENDNRKFTCFDPQIADKVGQEVEVVITEKVNGQYTNYIISFPKGQAGGKPFMKGNSNRQKALEFAIEYHKGAVLPAKEATIETAEFFLKWLDK